MSQVSIIDIAGNNPQVPTRFNADTGFAIPLANILNIVGINGISTIGSGNTITIDGSALSPALTITGDDGTPISPVMDNWDLLTDGTTIKFLGSSGTLTLECFIDNLIIGSNAVNITTAQHSTGLGLNALSGLVSGNNNTAIGTSSLSIVQSSDENTAVGSNALAVLQSGLGINTAVGTSSLYLLLTGTGNIAIGQLAGSALQGAESNNIYIGSVGVLAESNKIRIGTLGTQNAAFMQGIYGVTNSASQPVAIDTAGQLNTLGFGSVTQVLTSNGAGVSPTWQNPVADGVLTLTGNAGGAQLPDGSGNIDIVTDNTTAIFTGAGGVLTLDFGLPNLAIGSNFASLTTGNLNVAIGNSAMSGITSAMGSIGIGNNAAFNLDSGNDNISIGLNSLFTNEDGPENIAIGTGTLFALNDIAAMRNISIGYASLSSLLTGSSNIAIGAGAGSLLAGAESANIYIGSFGILGESSTTRIGSTATSTPSRTFISGIRSVTVAGSAPIGIDANGQLSSLGLGVATTILTSNGPGVSPTWQAPAVASVGTITGNSGGAISQIAGNWNLVTVNSTPKFVGTAGTQTLDFGLTNIALGSALPSLAGGLSNVSVGNTSMGALTSGAGNAILGALSATSLSSGSSNVIIGGLTAASLSTGSNNCIVGSGSAPSLNTSIRNTSLGSAALNTFTTGAANAGSNTAIGYSSLSGIGTGISNIGLGVNSGASLSTSDSSNIDIGHLGVTGDNNTIRIGTAGSATGQQSRVFVAGITGVTVAASAPTAVASSGQLSSLDFGTTTQVLTSNGPGVSPTWQAPAGAGSIGSWEFDSAVTAVNVVPNVGYVSNNTGNVVTYTLPVAGCAAGSVNRFVNSNAASLWAISQAAGQQIFWGSISTTLGVTGGIIAGSIGDCIEILCTVANTTWIVIGTEGNPTYT